MAMTAREARRKLGSRGTRKRARKALKHQLPTHRIAAMHKSNAKRDSLKVKK